MTNCSYTWFCGTKMRSPFGISSAKKGQRTRGGRGKNNGEDRGNALDWKGSGGKRYLSAIIVGNAIVAGKNDCPEAFCSFVVLTKNENDQPTPKQSMGTITTPFTGGCACGA